MAEEKIALPAFNLGIQDSEVYGDLKSAEDFLSGSADDLKKVEDEDEEEEKKDDKKVPAKKPLAKKKEDEEEIDPNKLAEDFLNTEDEEDKEDDKEEDKKDASKSAESEDDEEKEGEVNQFEALSKELYNVGVFSQDEGEEPRIAKDANEFLELFNEEKQKGATTWLENFLSRFGEDRRDMFDAIFVSGADPKEYLSTFNEIESFENLSLTEESNQERVVRTYYKRAGLADDKIQAKIDKLKSYGDLEEEANQFHPLIVEQDKKKLSDISEKSRMEQERKEALDEEYKAGLTKVLQEKLKEKSFDGIPLDEKKARAAYDYMYSKKWKTPSGDLLTDFDRMILESKRPENAHIRTKIALLALDNFDLSKIERKAISKESNSLFSSLVQKKEKKSNKMPTRSNDPWANL